jgi:hypothetical protein
MCGHLHALGINHHQLGALGLGAVDGADEVQVGDRDVVRPNHDQFGVDALFRWGAGHVAVDADIGLALDATAHRPAVQLAGAELVEESQIHRPAGQHAVGASVVERNHALCAEAGNCGRDTGMDSVKRFVPRDPLEPALAARADPQQRVAQAGLAVHEVRVVPGDLVADDALGQRIAFRAADGDDTVVFHRNRQAAGVGAVQRTDAVARDGGVSIGHG